MIERTFDDAVIDVTDLSFGYRKGGFHLRVPRLRFARGEKVAITGPSGSGKTTLIHLLAGILAPAAGRVELSGLDLASLGVDDRQDVRAAKMGLVFQEFELLDYLDVLDNILLPYRVSPVLRLDAPVRGRARRLAETVGLGDKLRRHPGELSQGERQRAAVCRAMVTEPSVVLGDEPTGNLDLSNRDQVMERLFQYSDAAGALLIVVTHDHELVDRFDRTVDVSEIES